MFYAFFLGLYSDLGENSDEIWVKTFFFALHLILGEKSDWFWVEQFLIQMFVLLKVSEVPAPLPPFFLNPAYATELDSAVSSFYLSLVL